MSMLDKLFHPKAHERLSRDELDVLVKRLKELTTSLEELRAAVDSSARGNRKIEEHILNLIQHHYVYTSNLSLKWTE